jgi:hypothetical protein
MMKKPQEKLRAAWMESHGVELPSDEAIFSAKSPRNAPFEALHFDLETN